MSKNNQNELKAQRRGKSGNGEEGKARRPTKKGLANSKSDSLLRPKEHDENNISLVKIFETSARKDAYPEGEQNQFWD